MEQNEESKIQEPVAKKNYNWVIWLIVGFIILILLVILSYGCAFKSLNSLKQMGTGTTDTATKWTEYNSTDGYFKITFPITPKYTSTNEKVTGSDVTFKNDNYIAEVNGKIAYMVNISFYPTNLDLSNVDNILSSALNGLVGSTEGNKLISSKNSDFNGNKAVDFELKNDAKKISMKGKIIFIKTNLVQIAISYEDGNYNDADYNKFISSFILK